MYGLMIRKIRMDKGMSLKSTYCDVCSKTNAIKFEKGERELNTSRFNQVLANLMLTMDEFLWLSKDSQPELRGYYHFWASKYWNENEIEEFEKLIQKAKLESNEMKKIQFAGYQLLLDYHRELPFDPACQQLIIDYFSELSYWTMEDLKFFANHCFTLPYDLFLVLLQEGLKAKGRYAYFPNSSSFFAALLTNSIERMLVEKDFDTAKASLLLLKEYYHDGRLSGFALIGKFYQAQIAIGTGDVATGEELIQKSLASAKFLENNYLIQEIEKYQEKLQ